MLETSALPLVAVSGSQRPYIFDLPHLLSLPIGFEFRFRYRHKWVDGQLLSEIDANGTAFVGRQIVLIFHSQDSKRIIPVRRGVVLGVESIGPMVYVRFRVGEFAKTDLSIQMLESQIPIQAVSHLMGLARELLGNVASHEEFDLSRPLPPGWYFRNGAQIAAEDMWDVHDHAAAWTRLVAILQTEPTLASIPFFYLLGFETEAGAMVVPSAVRNRFSPSREKVYGFPLVESERYRMRVVEWCEPPKEIDSPPVKVHCQFNDSHVALEGASNLVVGRYDVIEFTFSTLQTGCSEIALRAEPLQTTPLHGNTVDGIDPQRQASVAPWFKWPAIFVARVPIVVKPKVRRLLLPVGSLAVGLLLYLGVAPETDSVRWRGVIEILALGFLFFTYTSTVQHLEALFKLSAGMKKLRSGPDAWATGDES